MANTITHTTLLREYWKEISQKVFQVTMGDLWKAFASKVYRSEEIRNSPLYRSIGSIGENELDISAEAFWSMLKDYDSVQEYQNWNLAEFLDKQAALINKLSLPRPDFKEKFLLLRKATVEEIGDWLRNRANDTEDKKRAIFATMLTSVYWFFLTANSEIGETAFQVEHRYVLDYLEDKHLAQKKERVDRNIYFHNIIEIRRGNPILKDSRVLLTDEQFKISTDGKISIPNGEEWNACRRYLEMHAEELATLRGEIHGNLKRRNNGIFRSDDIVGVLSTDRYAELDGKPIGAYKLYETDYFTHRVVEALLEELNDHIEIDGLNDEKNGFRRTSLGVNVIVRIPKDKKIILVRRGASAAYNNAGRLYPSVVETVDLMHRDFKRDGINPIEAAISRGLEEELGIKDIFESDQNTALYSREQMLVRSLFYTQKYRQDNVFAVVSLNSNVSISKLDFLCSNVAADYAFENDGKFVCITDSPESIRQFIYDHYYEMIDQTHYCLLQYLALWDMGMFT